MAIKKTDSVYFVSNTAQNHRKEARSWLVARAQERRHKAEHVSLECSESTTSTTLSRKSPKDLRRSQGPDHVATRLQDLRENEHDLQCLPKLNTRALPSSISPFLADGGHVERFPPTSIEFVNFLLGSRLQQMPPTWGLASTIIVPPDRLIRNLSRRCQVSYHIEIFQAAGLCLTLHCCRTVAERKLLEIISLENERQALECVQLTLSLSKPAPSPASQLDGTSSLSTTCQSPDELSWEEEKFRVIFRLISAHHRFRPQSAGQHFAAARRLMNLRGRATFQSQKEGSRWPLVPRFRDPDLHHLVIAFECTHASSDSMAWDAEDLVYLKPQFDDFLNRVKLFGTEGHLDLLRLPQTKRQLLIPRDSLLWRCLTKPTGYLDTNVFNDHPETYGQLSALLILSSMCVDDYESSHSHPMLPFMSSHASRLNHSSQALSQCIHDLECSLASMGQSDATASAVHPGWIMAAGVGMLRRDWRARLWWVASMIYVIKHPMESCLESQTEQQDLLVDASSVGEYVKVVCLSFLENLWVDDPTLSH